MITQEYCEVTNGMIPGVMVLDQGVYAEAGGRYWPVTGLLKTRTGKSYIPVVDIPQMSDERWAELAKAHPAPVGWEDEENA